MKRRPQGSLPLSKAIPGFLQYKAAEGLSPNTPCGYGQETDCARQDEPSVRLPPTFICMSVCTCHRSPRQHDEPSEGRRHPTPGWASGQQN